MKRLFLACLLAATALPAALVAQDLPLPPGVTPFDMSGERKPDMAPVPKAATALEAAPVADPRLTRRFILSAGTLRLSGEQDQRSFTVTLTPEQAASAQSITLAYRNAVVVAPENSHLVLKVNNIKVGETPIAAPEDEAHVTLPLPTGVLRPGANLVTLSGVQRHRTDCSVQSTFDLWTDIQGADSFISFAGPVAGQLLRLEDLGSVAPDQTGRQAITIVAPALGSVGRADMVMRLSQGLALRMGGKPVSVQATLPTGERKGGLTVLLGTKSELAPLLPTLPAGAATAPTLGFAALPDDAASALIVSGPTQQAVQAAVERLATQAPADGATGEVGQRQDVPLLTGESAVSLSQLGVSTTEFSGRRLRTEFGIGLPADFYASAYGEAELLLDAAYAATVLPGSRINIYVNGNIATTTPLTTKGGRILRHLPIRVTMRHFLPGENRIAIEAVLLTDQDEACALGSAAQTTPRFALFDTSEFRMPDFARAASYPNLAATARMGAPYGAAETRRTAVYLDQPSAETLSAAATLVGQLTATSGRAFPLETVGTPDTLEGRDALIVGALPKLPPNFAARLGVSVATESPWTGGKSLLAADQNNTVDSWRDKVSVPSWTSGIDSVDSWLRRTFDLSLGSLSFIPGVGDSYSVPRSANVLLAQAETGGGTWTLAAAPTTAALSQGITALLEPDSWSKIAGRVAAFDTRSAHIETVAPQSIVLAATQPFSIAGWRLIAANWLSTNILLFSLLFVAAFAILGLITTMLLRGLGRRH
ncbi:cellulose biosynthesis cyclic di-GMP-binding regulatory protein BcsB [Rhizobium sp. YIM 134829]|uniref:cellulose biosynthesis cyclic di-GMP-binding regulatory protein BcsB n=1 Tax=Rhizobium sp. YIM 134829 TaxID=3390453 RepID=UPI00397A7F6C